MIEIDLDGQKVSVPEGSMVMHAADAAGTYIPHFCYHKKLTIAANCRMCLVDIEKAPKPMPACATPVTQGMIVRTRSDKALNAQQGVMEFLLINHPLDCPICDQGGECQLQDLAVGYGASSSRYSEEKRVIFPKRSARNRSTFPPAARSAWIPFSGARIPPMPSRRTRTSTPARALSVRRANISSLTFPGFQM